MAVMVREGVSSSSQRARHCGVKGVPRAVPELLMDMFASSLQIMSKMNVSSGRCWLHPKSVTIQQELQHWGCHQRFLSPLSVVFRLFPVFSLRKDEM